MGAVITLYGELDTHEAENMTSHSLGAEETSCWKLESLSSTTPWSAKQVDRKTNIRRQMFII